MGRLWFTFENRKIIMGGEKYTCSISEMSPPCDWNDIGFPSYYHKSACNNADVKSVIIQGASCKKIPEKLIEFFPNMESLELNKTDITELDKEALIKFKTLKRFASIGNKITILNGDLFDEFEN
ncbi:hypothetical protein ACKWTF_003544 [Chironomus riparius]